ncbi:hypothetical protein, conserved [Trypanosoma brucei brucei TREU927]|uniref:Uncharacterized protein n=1 Tax=Trypanosoma brucei brucei (strain 927/4 GUTat10.1) TaxID=185431 RepID=Q389J9_TRYB2|nr:hypothetical protein, conserved [Trypanosoma brucei brucei TREU927]EAN78521.1 hypothetical protein, conserved [Trypanosoma brucei brucei TREU927]
MLQGEMACHSKTNNVRGSDDSSGTNKLDTSRSPEVDFGPPPKYDDIFQFIAEHAGRLPRNAYTGTSPYEYTGCDYALVLYAIMPSKCIDLSRLCWSTAPLSSQLEGNLVAFCEGALGLQLSDAPVSSLTPHSLRTSPSCIMHHMKVQHWLYNLSLRFPPDEGFDAATIRMKYRHAQLGEPHLTAKQSMIPATASSSPLPTPEMHLLRPNVSGQRNPPYAHCQSLWESPLLEVEGFASTRGEVAALAASCVEDIKSQERPPKGYERRWRSGVPDAGGPVGAGGRARNVRQEHGKVTSMTVNSVTSGAAKGAPPNNLAEQWCESESRRLHLKDTLLRARREAHSTLFGDGVINFDSVLSILQGGIPAFSNAAQ